MPVWKDPSVPPDALPEGLGAAAFRKLLLTNAILGGNEGANTFPEEMTWFVINEKRKE
jgi:hypothetical protein